MEGSGGSFTGNQCELYEREETMVIREEEDKLEVSLEEMLYARENRVHIQESLMRDNDWTLISFTLNIPGKKKVCELYYKAFLYGEQQIEKALHEQKVTVLKKNICTEKTGYELFLLVESHQPIEIKRCMVKIEEESHVGRIFDIDVIRPDGRKVSRNEINQKMRKCILCEKEAHICSRNRSHKTQELVEYIQNMIKEEQITV